MQMTESKTKKLMIFVVVACIAILGVLAVRYTTPYPSASVDSDGWRTTSETTRDYTTTNYNNVTTGHNTSSTQFFDADGNVTGVMESDAEFQSEITHNHMTARCECSIKYQDRHFQQLFTSDVYFNGGNRDDVIKEYQDQCNQSCIDAGKTHFGLE